MTELPYHPIAEAFNLPLIEGAEFDAFVEDIRANKQCEAITVYQNKVLDGRNRYRACTKLGVEPRLTQFLGDDNAARAFVISKNVRRRHLTAEQRQSLLIAYIAGAPENSDRQLGAAIGVDHKTIASARAKGEDVGKIPHVAKRKDKGRKQPAKKPIKAKKPAKAKKPIKILNVATGELREATEEDIAAARATSKAATSKADVAAGIAADIADGTAAAIGASIIANSGANADPVTAPKRGKTPSIDEMIDHALNVFEAHVFGAYKVYGAAVALRLLNEVRRKINEIRAEIDEQADVAESEEHADAAQ
jgi:ParB-like chromosome segregation protein Spo0J